MMRKGDLSMFVSPDPATFPTILMDVYFCQLNQVKRKIEADPSLLHVRSTKDECFHDVSKQVGMSVLV